MTNLLQQKHITSQQIVYIFNAVIIPRIEYKINGKTKYKLYLYYKLKQIVT